MCVQVHPQKRLFFYLPVPRVRAPLLLEGGEEGRKGKRKTEGEGKWKG